MDGHGTGFVPGSPETIHGQWLSGITVPDYLAQSPLPLHGFEKEVNKVRMR